MPDEDWSDKVSVSVGHLKDKEKMSRVMRNPVLAYAKTKAQISCEATALGHKYVFFPKRVCVGFCFFFFFRLKCFPLYWESETENRFRIQTLILLLTAFQKSVIESFSSPNSKFHYKMFNTMADV